MKDRVKSANVTIRHCPTLRMIADFFTKPLQGNLLTFRDIILGDKHVNSLRPTGPAPSEEHVGKEIHTGASACVATGHNVDSTLTNMLDGSTGVTWADVVKGEQSKDSRRERRPTKNVVLRDHSLETIQ